MDPPRGGTSAWFGTRSGDHLHARDLFENPGVGHGTLVDVANVGAGDMDAGDDSLEAMLFREFVRSDIGAAGAESMLQAAADAIARGLRGVTVVDELDRGTCAVNDAMFSFRRRGWPT